MCHATNLTVGRRYVILARVDDSGEYKTAEKEFDGNNQTLLARLATACGLQAVYPQGTYTNNGKGKEFEQGAAVKFLHIVCYHTIDLYHP